MRSVIYPSVEKNETPISVNSTKIKFDWSDPRWQGNEGSDLFEELCYELVKLEGFSNLKWRDGSYDRGRDLQAEFIRLEPGGTERVEYWWFQCKRWKVGINRDDVGNAMDWAAAENVDYFVIMSSSHLTPTFQDLIEKSNENHTSWRYQVRDWNHKGVEQLVQKHINQIPNSTKYFAVEVEYEELLREIKQREAEREQEAQAQIAVLQKELETCTDPIACFQLHLKIAKIYQHELKQIEQAINVLHEAKEIVDNNPQQYSNLILKLADIYIEKESDAAIYEIRRAEEKFSKISDNEILFKLKYKSAQAYHAAYYIEDALFLYKDLLEQIEVSDPVIAEEIKLRIAEAYVDANNSNEALQILEKLETPRAEHRIKYLIIKFRTYNAIGNWQEVFSLFEQIESESFSEELRYKFLMELAFAHWQSGNNSTAVSILEEKCLPLIKSRGDEEQLMVLYQNLMLLSLDQGHWGKEFSQSHAYWSDIKNKLKGKHDRALLSSLYASEGLLEKRFRDSAVSLNRAKKIFIEISSWQDVLDTQQRLGNVFLQAGAYFDALVQFIPLGDEKKIEKVSSELIKSNDYTAINKYLDFLSGIIETSVSNNAEKTGFCYAALYLSEVISNDIASKIFKVLSNFSSHPKVNVSRNDIKGASVKALKVYVFEMKEGFQRDIAEKMIGIAEADIDWVITEDALKVLQVVFTEFQGKSVQLLLERLITLRHNHEKRPKSNLADALPVIDRCLYEIAKRTNNDEVKNQIITLLKGSNTYQSLRLYQKLGGTFLPDYKRIITRTVQLLNGCVVIEKGIEDREIPKSGGSGVISYFWKDGQRITVKELMSIEQLYLLDKSQVDEEIASMFFKDALKMLQNEHNSLTNRVLIIAAIDLVPIPDSLTIDVWNVLIDIAKGSIKMSEIKKQKEEERKNPFSANVSFDIERESLIAEAISVLSTMMNTVDEGQKEEYFEIYQRSIHDSSTTIRASCADSIDNFQPYSFNNVAAHHSFLCDSDERVVRSGIVALYRLRLDELSPEFREVLIRKVIMIYDVWKNSLGVSHEILVLLKKIDKHLPLEEGTKSLIERTLNDLKDHKYYSIRREFTFH